MIPARIAWACGLAAIALELTVSWGLPAAMPGHSLLTDYISTAGATDAPHPGWFAGLGITAASLHFVFVAGIWQGVNGRLLRGAVALFGLFFVFLAVGLAFQCDPGCALDTAEAWTHFWFGLSAFLCLGLAALILAWASWKQHDTSLLWLSVLLAVLDIALLLSDQTKVLQGLSERLVLLVMAIWGLRWFYQASRPIPGNGG